MSVLNVDKLMFSYNWFFKNKIDNNSIKMIVWKDY